MRVAGVEIAEEKHLEIALTSIYGIGRNRAKTICSAIGVEGKLKVKDLAQEQVNELRQAVSDYSLEGDLRREVQLGIKRLMDMGSYRGKRHRVRLPVRGQRTKTNARTRKGPRMTKGKSKKS